MITVSTEDLRLGGFFGEQERKKALQELRRKMYLRSVEECLNSTMVKHLDRIHKEKEGEYNEVQRCYGIGKGMVSQALHKY